MPKPGALIAEIRRGSLAAQAGLRKGDVLLSIAGRRPRDFIDYRYLLCAESLRLRVARPGRGVLLVHVEKQADEDLGLRFASDVFDGVRVCRCRCEFCFVSQLPPGLRPPLYLRDDDYRLSFLHGNFITLTNLAEADFHRILGLHLSPLWISVHATDPQVRSSLMGKRRLPDLLSQMRRLAEGGIELHAQVVICPGWNDGACLEKTVRDLASIHPGLRSVAVVPVGLNRWLTRKSNLQPLSAALAREIVQQVEGWQSEFLRQLGTRLVWASDEMYEIAGMDFPPLEVYEDFPQRANGVGEARLFLEEVESAAFRKTLGEEAGPSRGRPLRIVFATGAAASGLVARLAAKCNEIGLQARAVVATNQLFGPSISSAGLVCAADWAQTLRNPDADLIILPRQALNHEKRFLDDMSSREFARRVGVPVGFARTPLEAAALIARNLRGTEGENDSAKPTVER